LKYIFTILIVFAILQINAQQDISDARSMDIGQNVSVSGIVTNGNELGSIRYIQDNTAGIAAYDYIGDIIKDVKRGDSVTVTGTLKDYRNLLEIDPISSVVIHTSNNNIPLPVEISINQIGELYEGQLVRINNINLTNPSGSFQSKTNYLFTSSDGQAELRINSDLLANKSVPVGTFDLIGICSQYSYNSNDVQTGYQILPRDENDIILSGAIKIISHLSVVEFSKTTINLTWETDVEGQSSIRYGFNQQVEMLNNFVEASLAALGEGIANKGEIVGLNPASVVYAQGFTVVGSDTAFTAVKAFVTESNSTGEIKIYFNTEVEHSVATIENAEMLNKSMDDTLIAYINRAEETIDLCIYNINNSGISNITNALNSAHYRGVIVRAISCGKTAHSGLDNYGSDIPDFSVFIGPGDSERNGIMHNKFMVVDVNSADANNPIVWSGSTNLTEGQINEDANNMIFIQDQSLAKTYTIEFEEMWGGNGLQPNPQKAKFGNHKSDNTPHEFLIGGKRIECYFSPSDGTTQQIISTLKSADKQIDIATMLITRSEIAEAIIERKESGVEIHMVTNAEGNNDAGVNNILSESLGSNYVFDNIASNILHHKYAIIDHLDGLSDPLVLTGSHNWSGAANNDNDENTLIIHDATIANIYYQNFVARFLGNNGIINDAVLINSNLRKINVFPNPAQSVLNISSESGISRIEVFNISGVKVAEENIDKSSIRLNIDSYLPGMYVLRVFGLSGEIENVKILKE